MARTKAILAVSSLGFGAALVFVVATIQRDRFAFTAQEARDSFVPAEVTIVPPAAPSHVVEAAAVTEETSDIRIEALEVRPAERPLPRSKPAVPRAPAKPIAPPCQPSWRELESGPAGRSVRELCPAPDDVPRS